MRTSVTVRCLRDRVSPTVLCLLGCDVRWLWKLYSNAHWVSVGGGLSSKPAIYSLTVLWEWCYTDAQSLLCVGAPDAVSG